MWNWQTANSPSQPLNRRLNSWNDRVVCRLSGFDCIMVGHLGRSQSRIPGGLAKIVPSLETCLQFDCLYDNFAGFAVLA